MTGPRYKDIDGKLICEDCGVVVVIVEAHTRFHSILSAHAWALAVLKTSHISANVHDKYDVVQRIDSRKFDSWSYDALAQVIAENEKLSHQAQRRAVLQTDVSILDGPDTSSEGVPSWTARRTSDHRGTMTWRSVPLPPGWQQLRASILERDPFCRWGSIPEDRALNFICPMPSAEVDHIGSPFDHNPEMLRGLCSRHHATRSGRQGAAVRNSMPSLRKRPPDRHPGFR